MSNTVLAKKLNPPDDDRGTSDHYVKRLEDLLLAEPLRPFDQELKVGLDRTEVDALGIRSWHGVVVIVWHEIDRARIGLTTGYASNAVIGGEGCHWAGTNRYLQWIVDPLDIEGWGAKKVDRA